MPAYTDKELKQIQAWDPKPSDGTMFLHCSKCLKELPKDKSPKEYGEYYAASVPMPVGKKKIGVLVVFCKRHQIQVWDSRHLVHAY